MKLTNVTGISLPLAVWLASDGYDFYPGNAKAISATSLLKPVRQILLKEQLTPENSETPDVSDFIASRLGHSIHDGIERAWTNDYKTALRKLGYPEQVIQNVAINPEKVTKDMFPVYLEKRSSREIMGYTISGKFDQVLESRLHDFKSTSVYSYIKGSKDEDYALQGSIYRWLNPDIIKEDHMYIEFIFTDWQSAMAKQSADYPDQRVKSHKIKLLSVDETEAWITNKIKELESVAHLPEAELPRCSDKDLWRSDPMWKYYSNPAKTDGRSTKNFNDEAEANTFCATKGKGVVIHVPGKVKACSYCPAFPICTQKDEYDHG